MEVTLKPYQDKFLFSERRFPALVAGIGTGKTYMLLLKLWNFCNKYPKSIALIVRKEYTDLHDSTLKDFTRYFGVTIDSNKEYKFPNGSVLMFRHAKEVEVLKNINLSIFGIEQAEEFETDEQFIYLRDRLRNQSSPIRQGCIISNAQGHNWIWRMWVNNPSNEEYDCVTATTFDNEDNLPADFIADLKRMEVEAPNHYKQYVLNSFEEIGADDLLFDAQAIYSSPTIEFINSGTKKRILGVDIARFGDDETVFTVIESQNVRAWAQIYQDGWKHKNLMETTGRIIAMSQEFMCDQVVIDDCGVGGGVTDRLSELKINVVPFNGAESPSNPLYANKRSEGFFILRDLIADKRLKLINDSVLLEQLLTIRYKFKSNGEKAILSKDDMRKEGIKSPDRADALMMALYNRDVVFNTSISYDRLPREAVLT